MSAWQNNYKSMNAQEIIIEYQRLLTKHTHGSDWADRLNFLKQEFKIKVMA